jgi:hypothetical protein
MQRLIATIQRGLTQPLAVSLICDTFVSRTLLSSTLIFGTMFCLAPHAVQAANVTETTTTTKTKTKETTTATAVNPEHEARFSEACDCVKKHNYKEAHAKLQALASKDHAKSITLMGLLYERGLGVEKDAAKAADCYKRAAEKGLPEAESRLGHLLLDTETTVQKDATSAEHWLQKAANHGVAEAQATLGKLYYEGNHLPIKNSEAVHWLRRAAEQGHVEAQQMLDKVPGLKEANDRFHAAGEQYRQGMGNLEKSWQGYADIVNSVNTAASYQPRK